MHQEIENHDEEEEDISDGEEMLDSLDPIYTLKVALDTMNVEVFKYVLDIGF